LPVFFCSGGRKTRSGFRGCILSFLPRLSRVRPAVLSYPGVSRKGSPASCRVPAQCRLILDSGGRRGRPSTASPTSCIVFFRSARAPERPPPFRIGRAQPNTGPSDPPAFVAGFRNLLCVLRHRANAFIPKRLAVRRTTLVYPVRALPEALGRGRALERAGSDFPSLCVLRITTTVRPSATSQHLQTPLG